MAEGGDDHERALVDNFKVVTGADAERATFFLQSAAWNLQVMLSVLYYTLSNKLVDTQIQIIWRSRGMPVMLCGLGGE